MNQEPVYLRETSAVRCRFAGAGRGRGESVRVVWLAVEGERVAYGKNATRSSGWFGIGKRHFYQLVPMALYGGGSTMNNDYADVESSM